MNRRKGILSVCSIIILAVALSGCSDYSGIETNNSELNTENSALETSSNLGNSFGAFNIEETTESYYVSSVISKVNVRSGPGQDYDLLESLDPGTEVRVTGDSENGYFPIDFNGQTGYVHSNYISAPIINTDSLNSIVESETTAPESFEENDTFYETEGTTTSERTQSGTSRSQQNALNDARDYLSFMSFSYEGLVDQLEFEGYSHEDAVFAVDNCDADWNQQAVKSAQEYLDFMAFSYSGLIEQLEYEQFTSSQATYAADNCGADWNEQAYKSAQEYLSFMSFSHSELVSQLEFEGFTQSQAEYGVSEAGI